MILSGAATQGGHISCQPARTLHRHRESLGRGGRGREE
jgi:hypothetical protein